MGVIKSIRSLLTGSGSEASKPANSSEEKRWDDTLLAVRNGNLEEWNKAGVSNPYAQNYTVHRGLQILATNIAQVPFEFFKGEQKLGPDFELNKILRKPNPYTSNFELWEGTVIYLFLYGEAFWYLNTNQYGIIKEIYTLHPNYMDHVQKDKNSPIESWIYNNKIPMQLDEVVHFKLFNTGGVRGLSPLDSLSQDLSNEASSANLGGKMLKNGTRLSGVIEVDKDVGATLDDMRRVLSMWKKEHQGENKAGKVGALLGGMKYRELGQTMSDLQLIESRDSIRDRVLLVLGIHKAVVGVTDKIDRATADTALRSLWQTTLKPQTVRIQEKVNSNLLDIYYPGVISKFDLTVVEELKKDLNDTLDAATKLWKLGYTRNEINVRLGLRMPEDEGDERYIPRIMIPEEMAAEAAVTGRGTTNANDPRKTTKKPIVTPSEKENVDSTASQRAKNNEYYQFVSKIKSFLGLQRNKVLKVYGKYNSIDNLLEKEDKRLIEAFKPFEKQLPDSFNTLNKYIFGEIDKILSVDDKSKEEKIDAIKNLYKFLSKRVSFIAEGK